jgi:hypothetical protein
MNDSKHKSIQIFAYLVRKIGVVVLLVSITKLNDSNQYTIQVFAHCRRKINKSLCNDWLCN